MPTSTFFVGTPPPPFFKGTGPVFPDQDLVSMDDEQVKAILITLGNVDILGPPDMPGSSFKATTDDRHPTHRFFVVRYLGNKNDRDNGYVLYGWRRSHHSFADVERYVSEFVHQNSDGPIFKHKKGSS